MPDPHQNLTKDGGTECGSPPAALSAQDIDDYSARMLRDLARIAEAQHHDVLARLLHLAAAEARRLLALSQRAPQDNVDF
ncbi:MAG: hypothetical protein KGR48_01925 [Alphaproteobacteria bacterium]|nr:hypothetical protein [Alphaproteobacteria bacterium]MBU6472238.1 hypothetical protein [Alphaproteobacteria bacterium]MDE2012567.1 hypothetical protein [Alphaproteobacteria bacterium]MDE2073432.1 hypothetical protein [Alphaproteobacteria bacterium]MDE2350952.1 hypothetical protein [Alphaproteobacteria bacterium]